MENLFLRFAYIVFHFSSLFSSFYSFLGSFEVVISVFRSRSFCFSFFSFSALSSSSAFFLFSFSALSRSCCSLSSFSCLADSLRKYSSSLAADLSSKISLFRPSPLLRRLSEYVLGPHNGQYLNNIVIIRNEKVHMHKT